MQTILITGNHIRIIYIIRLFLFCTATEVIRMVPFIDVIKIKIANVIINNIEIPPIA